MKKKVSQPGQEDNILTLSHMLSNRIGNAFTLELFQYEVTASEWRVMLTLGQYGQATAKDITTRWAMDKMAISRAISNLEQRRLIKKQKNKTDKRSYDLMLTKNGNTLYEQILPVANHLYHELLEDMNKQEIRDLHDALIKLIDHIDGVMQS